MRIKKLILPTFALGLAAVMLTPDISSAFLKFNWSLNLNQRTVRLFNNFTAGGANNNAIPDPQFPGKVGADLSIWKAIVEWGSESHGDGSGDPTQGNLGDGGANFDAHFVGNATSAGVFTNVMSQITGCSGGVFAFQQGGGSGWRIRFYECWFWADGPGFIGGGNADLQGIGVHEYGHALGLGHSGVGGATMFASTSTGVVGTRSIHADDIAGLQCKYGVKSPTKPHIDSITGGGNSVTITGTNLPANCEVWFPRADPSAPNTTLSLKVGGLTSNGTTVNLAFPAGAGPGDVLVRNTSSSAGSALSNAFPFEPTACPPPLFYCTAKAGLVCGTPAMSTFGVQSAAATNGFFILGGPARSNKSGILLYTDQGANAAPFNGGTLCIQTPLKRSSGASSGGFGTCDGEFALDMNAFASGNAGGNPAGFLLTAGNVIFTQWWGRDSVATGSFLSDGMHYTVCP